MSILTRALVAACIVLAVLMAGGCGRDDGGKGDTPSPAVVTETAAVAASPTPTGTPAAPPPESKPATAPAGCALLPADIVPGRPAVRSLMVHGTERTYRVHLPAGAESAAGMPVVLNFHGLGSSALEQEAYSGLVPLSDREGFLLVTPDGTGTPRGWAFALSGNSPGDDLAFFDALLGTLEEELCVDSSRVYATGMSNGAFFSSLLGCLRPESVAAIAPVAGVAWAEGLGCGGAVPVIAFHGVADAVVPFYGGQVFGVIPYSGAPAAIAGWAGHNGCSEAAPVQEQLTEHVEVVRYEGCEAATELIAVTDGGHTWPGGIAVPRLGATTKEISAAELAWAFFEEQGLE